MSQDEQNSLQKRMTTSSDQSVLGRGTPTDGERRMKRGISFIRFEAPSEGFEEALQGDSMIENAFYPINTAAGPLTQQPARFPLFPLWPCTRISLLWPRRR